MHAQTCLRSGLRVWYLVALGARCQEGLPDGLLSAIADNDVGRRVMQAIVSCQLGTDGCSKCRRACIGGVPGVAAPAKCSRPTSP